MKKNKKFAKIKEWGSNLIRKKLKENEVVKINQFKKLSQVKQTTIKRMETKFKRSKHCASWFFFNFLFIKLYTSLLEKDEIWKKKNLKQLQK